MRKKEEGETQIFSEKKRHWERKYVEFRCCDRTAQSSEVWCFFRHLNTNRSKDEVDIITFGGVSVSYTHLDVYKRQLLYLFPKELYLW